jgi:hypothetical protein
MWIYDSLDYTTVEDRSMISTSMVNTRRNNRRKPSTIQVAIRKEFPETWIYLSTPDIG